MIAMGNGRYEKEDYGRKAMLEHYPDVLTVDEVCNILRIARKTVYSLVKSGDLPSRRIGRIYRISKKQLVEYLAKAA